MVSIPVTLDRSKQLRLFYTAVPPAKRNVRIDRHAGVPDYLYRVGNWVVACANIVDAETGVGLADKPVWFTITRGMEDILHELDTSRAPDGWIIKQVSDARANGYTVTWDFPGDDQYNPLSVSYTKVLPGA
jgi:hypothetical protein